METYKILHLEDVAFDAEMVARTLKRNNFLFEHLVLDKREEYVDAIHSFSPDIILCDHSLPSFNSFEALRIVKSFGLNIPFIVITATMSEDVAMTLVREGADDYILKDRLTRLPFAVINAIDKYRNERDRTQLIDGIFKRESAHNAELQKLSGKLLLATRATGLGTWEYDFASNLLEPDNVLLQIYGMAAKDFDGAPAHLMQYVHHDDRDKVLKEFRKSLIDKNNLNIEFRIVRSDGAIRWIKAVAIVHFDGKGKVNRLLGTNQDITAEKLAEIAIKESEDRYRSFFENSLDGILITKPNGTILSANPAACAMFKMTASEICCLNRRDLFGNADTDKINAAIADYNNEKRKVEVDCICKDGSTLPVELTSSIYSSASGEPKVSLTMRDITERKKAEQALVESEAFNRSVLDSLSSHIAVINSAGTIVNVNKAWKDFALLNGAEINSQNCEGAEYFRVENYTDNNSKTDVTEINAIKQVLQGRQKEYYAEYPCHSPWEQRWFYMKVKKFVSSETMAVIEHINITEQKKAEDQLLATSAKLQKALTDVEKIMDSSVDIICSIDKARKFVSVSSAAHYIWGYQPNELIGQYFMDYVFQPDKMITAEVAANIMAGKAVNMFENRMIKKDGSVVTMLWSAKWDDEEKMMYCVAKDATEKKKMEAAYDFERSRLLELIANAPIGVGILIGREHIFEMVNNVFLKLTGRQNIIGESVYNVFPELTNQRLFEILDEVFNSGKSLAIHERLIKIDIENNGVLVERYFDLVCHPYCGNEHKVEGILFFVMDVTERKLIENEREHLIEHLVKSNNDLKQFSYITSHNFRAPLSNLIGLLNLIDDTTLTQENKEVIKMFETSTQQLNKTINDLIQILIIKNNLSVNIVKNNINEAYSEIIQLLSREIAETKTTIIRDLEVDEVVLNKSYLQSILLNLVSNAIKYRSAKRKLVIEISSRLQHNGDVLLTVKDNGSGINLKRHKDRIFGLYQRFHSNIDGAGLGLYMVKTQVMALGGKIEVDSEEEVGTTFYITLKANKNLVN